MALRHLRFLPLWALLTILSGCPSIPREAPELSAELGKRLTAIEQSHLELLRQFMGERRRRVDEFVNEKWVPEFASQYFQQPGIRAAWEEVVRSNDPKERLKLLTTIGPRLVTRINAERAKLMEPLDSLERDIETKLRAEYQQARAINNSVTSFLTSAAKVAENRDRLLSTLGVSDEEVRKAIDETDKVIENLMEGRSRATNAAEELREFGKRITDIRNRLRR